MEIKTNAKIRVRLESFNLELLNFKVKNKFKETRVKKRDVIVPSQREVNPQKG